MRHFAAHAVDGRLLFESWAEGLALWRAITWRVPGSVVCLMPDHLHVLAGGQARDPLRAAMSAHARLINHRRRTVGRLWRPLSDTGEVRGREKVDRSIRYIHLNPCRAGLVDDPLAWPLSTHRDLVGLALRPVVPARRDPAGFHRYVSSDPHVRVDGTSLPFNVADRPSLHALVDAVSSLARCTDEHLRRRGWERDLLIRALKAMSDLTDRQIAEGVGVGLRTVERARALDRDTEQMLLRVLHDPRFVLILASEGPRRARR